MAFCNICCFSSRTANAIRTSIHEKKFAVVLSLHKHYFLADHGPLHEPAEIRVPWPPELPFQAQTHPKKKLASVLSLRGEEFCLPAERKLRTDTPAHEDSNIWHLRPASKDLQPKPGKEGPPSAGKALPALPQRLRPAGTDLGICFPPVRNSAFASQLVRTSASASRQ